MVKVRPHPRINDFKRWPLDNAARATTLQGEFFRVAGPRHTSAADIVSGNGGLRAGGRWHAGGLTRVLYLSETPETAMAEANANLRYHGLSVAEAMPRVTVAVRIRIGRGFDLRPNPPGDPPDNFAELMAEDWRAIQSRGEESASQALGRAAFEAGADGLLVPSAADPNGTNIVVFPETTGTGIFVDLLNADLLERLGK